MNDSDGSDWRGVPSTTALRAFETAADLGSFSAAAERLCLTQGAVSHQIRELELRLAVQLFDRGARGIRLTDAGARYLPFVRDALASLRTGAGALARLGGDRVLTVSMSPNFATKWLVPRLGDFMAACPDLELRISASMEHVVFDGQDIDMAIRHGDGDWPHLHVTRLCRETVFPVCAPALVPAGGLTIDRLTHVPLLHDRDRGAWQTWLLGAGVSADANALESGPVFNQTALAIDAAAAGQGVALARSALVTLDLEAGRLVRPVSHAVDAPFAYYVVCPPDLAMAGKVQRFTAWLLAQADVGR